MVGAVFWKNSEKQRIWVMCQATEHSNKFSALTAAPSLFRSTLAWIDINFGGAKDMNVKLFTMFIVINIHIQQYIAVPSVTYLTNKVHLRKTCITSTTKCTRGHSECHYGDAKTPPPGVPTRLLRDGDAISREHTNAISWERMCTRYFSSTLLPCTLIFANYSNKLWNSPEF